MPISREAVCIGFRMLLGREVSDEDAIRAHMALPDECALAEVLFASREFAMFNRFRRQVEVVASAPPVYGGPRACTFDAPLLFIGNCQSRGLARLVAALTGSAHVTSHELLPAVRKQLDGGELDAQLHQARFVFLHDIAVRDALAARLPALAERLRLVPGIAYPAFHPDADYVFGPGGEPIAGLMGQYQSSLAFYGWSQGLSLAETRELFREEVYAQLGFFAQASVAKDHLLQVGRLCGLALDDAIDAWARRGGPWMYSMNHPRLFVLADVARALLAREGIATLEGADVFVHDDLADGPVWPVYPEVGARLGLPGSLTFKLPRGLASPDQPVLMLGLDDFLASSFELFASHPHGALRSAKLSSARYQGLADWLKARAPRRPMPAAHAAGADRGANPYHGLAGHQFWRRGVEKVEWTQLDPVVSSPIAVAPSDRVATAGSCFAQHISRTLERSGFRYFVAEDAPAGMPAAEQAERNYRVFSARYGNLYTARQLLQLMERAYGRFVPVEDHWQRDDGRFVDPFRPQVEPAGFASVEDLRAARAEHLAEVRRMFEQLDVLVFTLGLTETWRHREDGAVFPLAPGVAGGDFEPARHEFVNVGVAEVVHDLRRFLQQLREINPRSRVIFTVSPVPLIATYEPRHVLVSTTLSKSVLRAAAQEVVDAEPACAYFPSYEIITGHYNKGAYFDSDLRSVTPDGVAHVMRLFMQHCARSEAGAPDAGGNDADTADLRRELDELGRVICDEEAIDPASAR